MFIKKMAVLKKKPKNKFTSIAYSYKKVISLFLMKGFKL